MPVWYAIHFGKNIFKFVFENSWFQIAEAFQCLLCGGRSAAVVNKSPTCWATIDIVFISLKPIEKVQRVTLSCSCCSTDTVTKVWVAVKWSNLLWKFSTFSVTFIHTTGPSHFVNAIQVHGSLWVTTTVHTFRVHSVRPLLGHQMTWSSQFSVNTSCVLSN